MSVDICANNSAALNKVCANNTYFNYKSDSYYNHISVGSASTTNSVFFFNRIWLEREVSETFNIKYFGIKDTRPLLLNYGDETGIFLKDIQVQTVTDIKTN